MSVIVEFTISASNFPLGEVLLGHSLHIELDRVVPTGNTMVPYFWATGADANLDSLDAALADSPYVIEFTRIDHFGEHALYRVMWEPPEDALLAGIILSDAVILESRANVEWLFRLRFPDHDRLADFYNYCTKNDISIHVERIFTLTEDSSRVQTFDLTPEQREALVLALRRGYFATPSKVSLDDLADDLEVSAQALSKRIRRANEKILDSVL